MQRFSLLLVVLILFAAGCLNLTHSVLVSGLAPVAMEDVTVYFPTDELPDHTRVALLYAAGSDVFTSRAAMVDKFRALAGKLGANGIILMEMDEASPGEQIANALGGGGSSGTRRGDAIAIFIE